MKHLTIILTTIALLSLRFQASGAQPPVLLQPIVVQDLSDGLKAETAPAEADSTPDAEGYFDGEDEDSQPSAEPELIPLGEESESMFDDGADQDSLDESDDDDDESSEASRERATRKHIEQLQKSICSIQLSAGINRTDVPKNEAEEFEPHTSETLITSSGVVTLPERYTTCIYYRPLYYEQANLERCGNAHGCLQNIYSGARFFSTTMLLACKMGRQCPDQLVCTLGDCKTCQRFPVKTDPRPSFCGNVNGILSEAAALAGFSLLML